MPSIDYKFEKWRLAIHDLTYLVTDKHLIVYYNLADKSEKIINWA